ncbi:MAG: beta-hydroxyacyl-ACP dehydratase [Deltaproteobacteria bacterium]|nr:beta-hydroxyacyl-ACP dehydratase [Deltaproteobacteria bacterium]
MSKVEVSRKEIERLLPHRAPFLFVDRVTELEEGKRILAERKIRPEEPHFAGHFPDEPIMPGVLITEALAQTSGLLLALTAMRRKENNTGRLFYLARADMKWTEPVRPGATLMLEAELLRTLGRLVAFRVRAFTRRDDVAGGSLTLAQMKSQP